MAGKSNTSLASVFGGGSPSEADADIDLGDEAAPLPEGEGPLADDEAPEAMPPDFQVHALEAFPDMDDVRIDALYRAIKSCAGGI